MATWVISGASGLVGSALATDLLARGERVLQLVRRHEGAAPTTAPDSIPWDPKAGRLDDPRLAEADVVVHLAGESVAGGRWTAARKERIQKSRVDGTATIARALAALPSRPQGKPVLLCASAVGIYGDRGDELLDEDSAPGADFLAEVCRAWEQAAEPARQQGLRVVHLRIGMVLSRHGGALAKMLLPFRLGLGGPVGDGRQFVSWIGLPDLLAAFRFAAATPTLRGPVNAVAPAPVPQRAFARALGRALHRPAFLPLPAFAARLLFGELADGLLLASQRVAPRRLQAAGFTFGQPALDGALAEALAR